MNEIYFIYFLQKKKISRRSEFSPGDGVSIMGRPPPFNPQLQLTAATRIFFQNDRNCMICFISIVLTSCEKMKLFWWAKPEILMLKNCEKMPKMAENREMTSLAIKWRHHLQTFWNFVTSFNIIKINVSEKMKLFPSSNLEFLQISYFSQIHVESVKWRLCNLHKKRHKVSSFCGNATKIGRKLEEGCIKVWMLSERCLRIYFSFYSCFRKVR